jgi:hypothetical protein
MPWIIASPSIGSVIEDAAGELWTNLGSGPGPLFPTATLTMVGNDVWNLVSDSPQTNGNRFVQLLGYGNTAPQQGYVMWEGQESQFPLNINLFGLPFGTLRLRYRLPNGCEYLSDILTTIPEIDPEDEEPVCGTITVVAGTPFIEEAGFFVPITLSNQAGYPLGALQYVVDGGAPLSGVVPTIGTTNAGPFPMGSEAVITITNIFDPTCNITLDPITLECPTLEYTTEVVIGEGGDPPIDFWGVLLTATDTSEYGIAGVSYSTPLSGTLAAEEIAPGVWACGPVPVDGDPGPMTVTIINADTTQCNITLTGFVPADACGNLEYFVGDPVIEDDEWTVDLLITNLGGFALGAAAYYIDGDGPQDGPSLSVGNNVLGPFAVGESVIIEIINTKNPSCNILVGPIDPEPPSECADCLGISEFALCISAGENEGLIGPISTSTGYFTVIDQDGNPLVFTSSDQYYIDPLQRVCTYPSLDDGEPSGDWNVLGERISVIQGSAIEGSIGECWIIDLVCDADVFVVPYVKPTGVSSELYLSGQTVDMSAVDLSECENALSLTGITTLTIQSPVINMPYLQIILNSVGSSAQDTLANSLDPMMVGFVGINNPPISPTIASKPSRQALLDSGNWTLDVLWTADLDT